MRKFKRYFPVVILPLVILLGSGILFQNCAKVSFSDEAPSSIETANTVTGTPTPAPPTPTPTPTPTPSGPVSGCEVPISGDFGAAYSCPLTKMCNGHLAHFYDVTLDDSGTGTIHMRSDCQDSGNSFATNQHLNTNSGIIPHIAIGGFDLTSPGCQASGTGYFVLIPPGRTEWRSTHECRYSY